MKRFILFIFISLWFVSTAMFCFRKPRDDSHDPLPPATQDGRGTFACYVNDKAFIGRPYNCFFQYDPQNGRYYMALEGIDNDYERNHHYPNWIAIEGSFSTWQIPNDTIIPLGKATDSTDSVMGLAIINTYVCTTDSIFSGEVHITRFDLENYIISGTFWFDVYNGYAHDTLHVRDGRFDVRISI